MRPYTFRRAAYVLLTLLALALLVPGLAFAQYHPSEVLDKAFQARVVDVGKAVQAQFPVAWRNAHDAGEPQGSEFVRRWALALRAAGINACVNGKRGSDTLSQDVVAFPVTEGWGRDTRGDGRGRILIVDVIVAAGASNARIDFGPDTSGADGKCIEPFLESSENGTPTPVPGPPPVTPPPTSVDLGPVQRDIAALHNTLSSIQARLDGKASKDDTETLYRLIADQLIAEHIGGLVERLDKLQQDVAAIRQRVDRARILGY